MPTTTPSAVARHYAGNLADVLAEIHSVHGGQVSVALGDAVDSRDFAHGRQLATDLEFIATDAERQVAERTGVKIELDALFTLVGTQS